MFCVLGMGVGWTTITIGGVEDRVSEHSNHNVCVRRVFRLPCVEIIPKEAARRQHFLDRHTVSSDRGQIKSGGESKLLSVSNSQMLDPCSM